MINIATAKLETPHGDFEYYRLSEAIGDQELTRLPFLKRVFAENVVRSIAEGHAAEDELLAATGPGGAGKEFGFRPARVVLQDFTGVPLVTSFAAMREAVARRGLNVETVNPRFPVDLVVDHSVIVDEYGTPDALAHNVAIEMARNRERYEFLKWAQGSLRNFRVVPPGMGIVHQVNLEYLASVVVTNEGGVAYPDTLVGTDSHTTMISGIGVLGWGVGGIEAEAAMLGEPVGMLTPIVVGVRLEGQLREGATATDLVLAITQLLREHVVVGKFVEFFGAGLRALSVPDRATVANMSPEYGATTGYFPIDDQTLEYLRATGRDERQVALVDAYSRAQRLFHTEHEPVPEYDELIEFDLGMVVPSVAGPRRPQDRLALGDVKQSFRRELTLARAGKRGGGTIGGPVADSARRAGDVEELVSPRHLPIVVDGETEEIADGSVVIAAITSCTNTSNPSVMLAAGLLARNAVLRGLGVRKTVKTSLAPGSQVVVDYLKESELLEPLEELGFFLAGYGCTTCIGNSGPLPEPVATAIVEEGLVCSAVLSGNRNFEGRIHPLVRFSYLMSPPLVVAYAIAGTTDIDLDSEPIGIDSGGNPVFLRDIWPTEEEVTKLASSALDPATFRSRYAHIFDGDEAWRNLPSPVGALYQWDPASTYILEPPFVADIPDTTDDLTDITGARALLLLGDSVTTDHISPAGAIPESSPAGAWLLERGVTPENLHSYGARRGNHEVMVRGTFANIRIRNRLVPDVEGGFTAHLPDGDVMTVFEAACRYRDENVQLIVIAGKEYGSGSSRDWAAKGTALLGVRAVLAQSFERIHRSNLVQMGVLPLEFLPGENPDSLGLTGREAFDITGIASGLAPGGRVHVVARGDGAEVEFGATVRIDSETELDYYRQGGILPKVLRELVSSGSL